ncbi:IS5 family transposase [Aureimonas sp. SA4125]|uniref:IS5 family transposase n=1 Tax=Aureimonas sp. SA4125 TaxID=2826993 RepID=UPI001CC6A245|nr:IS5 family transposase [Aureimonas sp. SA4125]BDA82685.1 IS5 family transposase [Aureimonas sp. SA4125]BDA85312.1 IS5 family transposase [Aureimonas sp. SA4125]
MRPRERRDSGQSDLFRARLDQIVDMRHPLARLGRVIDWRFLEERFGTVYSDGPGQPPLPTRLMAGLAILKSMHDLSDEALCDRWVENPYFQLFCGEEFFRHALPFDRSSMTRWRQRMGEERLNALVQESLATALRTGAAKPADFTKAVVDTTVQPKAVAHPTDARLMHRARERLVRLAKTLGLDLRQSYARLGKIALIRQQRYAHAKQFKRAGKALRTLRTYLGRVIRDIVRKAKGDAELEAATAQELMLARRVHAGNRNLNRVRGMPRDADLRVFSLHAPEVECIGKGKAHRPYEFGVKVSVATTLTRSKGGQFVTHVAALPGKPYDGHTLAAVIPAIEAQIGATLTRIIADAGYKGHNAPQSHRFKVYTAGQKRGMTDQIRREMRRRSAVEPVIGHLKEDHRMGRNHLAHTIGDAANAVLAAVGYNFRRILAWLSLWLAILWSTLIASTGQNLQPETA